jgi:hypothetical protein
VGVSGRAASGALCATPYIFGRLDTAALPDDTARCRLLTGKGLTKVGETGAWWLRRGRLVVSRARQK